MVAECLGLDPFCTIVGFHDDILVNPVRAVAGLKVRRSPTPTFGRVLTGVWVDAVFVLARSAVPYANINRIVDRILERPFSWWATIGHSTILFMSWIFQHSDPLLFRNALPGEWHASRIVVPRGAICHPNPFGRVYS